MIEGVGCALLHIVVEEPGDHLALVEHVFLKRNEVYEDPLFVGLFVEVGAYLLASPGSIGGRWDV